MTLGTREGIVAVIWNEPVTAGHVALVFLLDELDVAQPMTLHLGLEGVTFCNEVVALGDQDPISTLGLPQALTYLVELLGQQIHEIAAVRQLRGAEQGLLLFEAILLITKHVHSGPPAHSLKP